MTSCSSQQIHDILAKLDQSDRNEAHSLLLQLGCQFSSDYVSQRWEARDDLDWTSTIQQLNGIIRVDDNGDVLGKSIVSCSVDYLPAVRQYFVDQNISIDEGHVYLAQCCLLDILKAQKEPELFQKLSYHDRRTSWLRYAIDYWLYHVQKAESVTSKAIDTDLIVAAFGTQDQLWTWKQAVGNLPPMKRDEYFIFDPLPETLYDALLSMGALTTIHRLARYPQMANLFPDLTRVDGQHAERLYFNVSKTNNPKAIIMLKEKIGPPAQKPKKYSALARATLGRNHDVMRLFLEEDVSPMWPKRDQSRDNQEDPYPNLGYFPSMGYRRAIRVRKTGEEVRFNTDADQLPSRPPELKNCEVPLLAMSTAIKNNDSIALRMLKDFGYTLDWANSLTKQIRSMKATGRRSAVSFMLEELNRDTWPQLDAKERARKLFLILHDIIRDGGREADVVRQLLDYGADPNLEPRDEKGHLISTPIDMALFTLAEQLRRNADETPGRSVREMLNSEGRVVRCLLEAGAKIDIYARMRGKRSEIVSTLIQDHLAGKPWDEIVDHIIEVHTDDGWQLVDKMAATQV